MTAAGLNWQMSPTNSVGEIRVVVGPPVELHNGVHGSLFDAPPSGVRYEIGHGRHEYVHHPRAGWSPFEHAAVDEAVSLGPAAGGRVVVHTSRVPATGAMPWVVDCDCLLVTLLLGRDLAVGHGVEVHDAIDHETQQLRQRALLARYLAPSCSGILFHTAYGRATLLDHVADTGLLDTADLARLADRAEVVRPAVRPGPARSPDRETPLRVTYMGRDATTKGVEVAARVFDALASRDDVALCWVGELPAAPLAPVVAVRARLGRSDWLDLLTQTDVLFSPTEMESFGMGFIEAAAHGAAIVTTTGPGMEHIGELLHDGRDGCLVSLMLPPDARVRAFVEVLTRLADEPARARAMGSRGRDRAAAAVDRRDDRLLHHYHRMWAAGARGAVADAPRGRDGLAFTSIATDELSAAYRSRMGGKAGRNIVIGPGS
jgi:glycosyltransferase involved in cell wall biosynthesis